MLASATGERALPLDEFFVSYRKTALAPGEILKSILIPRIDAGSAFRAQVLQGFETARDGHQHGGRRLRGVVRRKRDDRPSAACFRRSRGHAGARAQDRAGADRQSGGDRKRCEEVSADSGERVHSDLRRARERGLSRAVDQDFVAEVFCGRAWTRRGESRRKIRATIGAAGESPPHESGHKHVTGEAIYVDDVAQAARMLEVWPVCSPHAHAKILRRDATEARAMPGVPRCCWPKMCRA